MELYYKLVGRTVKPLKPWQLSELQIGERVALSKLSDCKVSTIFLAINHNFRGEGGPILFETMVFGGDHNEDCQRYPGWKEYTLRLPKWTDFVIVTTVPGWYLAWMGHWSTVFKLLWEHVRGGNLK